MNRLLLAWRVSLAVCTVAPVAAARHLPALTAAEERCQVVLGPATDRLGARTARCLARCDAKASAGKVPRSECVRPFAGQTAACVAAAETQARVTMERGCRADCPECYGGDCASFRDVAVTATGAVVDGLARDIFCDADVYTDPGALRCRRGAARVLAKVAVATGRCVVACQRREQRGRLAAETCTTTPVRDAATATCLARTEGRGGAVLAAACGGAPPCLAAVVPTLVARVRAQIVADYVNAIFCDSPSGAFP